MKGMRKSTAVIATYEEEHLADIAQAKLISAGVPTEVSISSPFRWNPFAEALPSRYSVLVPGKYVKKAKAILGKSRYA